jgi:hypothetical protein
MIGDGNAPPVPAAEIALARVSTAAALLTRTCEKPPGAATLALSGCTIDGYNPAKVVSFTSTFETST